MCVQVSWGPCSSGMCTVWLYTLQVCRWWCYAGQWKTFEVAGSLNRGLFFCGSLVLCQKESWPGWWSCLPIRATNGHKARRLGFLPMSAARETREWGFVPKCLRLLSQKVASWFFPSFSKTVKGLCLISEYITQRQAFFKKNQSPTERKCLLQWPWCFANNFFQQFLRHIGLFKDST